MTVASWKLPVLKSGVFRATRTRPISNWLLHHAIAAGYTEILIVAALGNRLDQTLGNLALLTDPSLAGLDVRVDDGVEQAWFIRTQVPGRGSPW